MRMLLPFSFFFTFAFMVSFSSFQENPQPSWLHPSMRTVLETVPAQYQYPPQ